MKTNFIVCLTLIISISSLSVSASNAPPAIPIEYWGRAIIDGSIAPMGTLITSQYGNATVDSNGYYSLMLAGGDSPLTDLNDSTCTLHQANGEGCIPCSTIPTDPDYCIEGPKEGDTLTINFSSSPVNILWQDNVSFEERGLSSLTLYTGWNMVSIPVILLNSSVQSVVNLLTGQKLVDYYNATTISWERYNSGTPPFTWTLSKIEPGKGYWMKVDSAQKWVAIGNNVGSNTVKLKTGWNLVSFQFYNGTVQNATAQLSGTKLVDYYDASSGAWKRYNSGTPPFTWTLSKIEPGKGYWVNVDSDQTWVEP